MPDDNRAPHHTLAPQEVNRVSEVVTSLADPSANVIFGAVIDDQVCSYVLHAGSDPLHAARRAGSGWQPCAHWRDSRNAA